MLSPINLYLILPFPSPTVCLTHQLRYGIRPGDLVGLEEVHGQVLRWHRQQQQGEVEVLPLEGHPQGRAGHTRKSCCSLTLSWPQLADCNNKLLLMTVAADAAAFPAALSFLVHLARRNAKKVILLPAKLFCTRQKSQEEQTIAGGFRANNIRETERMTTPVALVLLTVVAALVAAPQRPSPCPSTTTIPPSPPPPLP